MGQQSGPLAALSDVGNNGPAQDEGYVRTASRSYSAWVCESVEAGRDGQKEQ